MTAVAAATAANVATAHEQEHLIREHIPLVGHLVRDMLSRVPRTSIATT